MIQNKDLYTTVQSAKDAYWNALLNEKTTTKTFEGWLFSNAFMFEEGTKEDETTKALKDYLEATSQVLKAMQTVQRVKQLIQGQAELIQSEAEPEPMLCASCRHAEEMNPELNIPTYMCRKGWNMVVHSCKECDEYERRTGK